MFLDGVLSSEFMLNGSGTFVGAGILKPKTWKIRLRDCADASISTVLP